MYRQPRPWTMKAERLGAMAAPVEPLAVQVATAVVRRDAGKPGNTNASEDGTASEPPRP